MTDKEKEFYILLNGWKKLNNRYYLDDDPTSYVIVGPFDLKMAFNKSKSGINSYNSHADERITYYGKDENKNKICDWQISQKSKFNII